MKKVFSKSILIILSLLLLFSLKGCSESKELSKDSIIWTFKADASIVSTPVILNNDIIFGSKDKKLYSVNLDTHEKNWSFESNGTIKSNPLIDGENVIFTTESTCYLLNANDGRKIWSYNTGDSSIDTIDGYDFYSPSPTIYKNLIIYQHKNGTIYAINKDNGSLAWKYKDSECSEVIASPVIKDNLILFADIKGNCFVMNLDNQSIVWKNSIGSSIVHSVYVYNDLAYFCGRDKKLVAFNLKDGSEKWKYTDADGSWITSNIIIDNDILYVGGSDNHKVLSFNYQDGTLVDEFKSNVNIFSKPTIDNGTLYFSDADVYSYNSGNLYSYNLNNSSEKEWILPIGSPLFTSPVIKDDIIYIGSTNGILYAIKK